MKPTGEGRFVGGGALKGQATLQERGLRPVPLEAARSPSGRPVGQRLTASGRRRSAARFEAKSWIAGGSAGGNY